MKFLDEDRLLAEVELEPIQGSRFQPTGFPSLGSAEFTTIDNEGKNINSLLVESAQSMANRLEVVCMNDTKTELVEALADLPVIKLNDSKGNFITNSILEAHRMNSSYLIKGKDKTLFNKIISELDITDKNTHVPDISKFANFVFKYDTNSILHGLFLAISDIAGGRYKLTRSLSSFIEASNIKVSVSGGVKLDHVDPKGGDGGAEKGYGHIPYSRTEYTAESIKAYFSIDLSLIRSYGLSDTANEFLLTFALWKIQSFLKTGLRLRTACDLKVKNALTVTYPNNVIIPSLDELDVDLRNSMKKCKDEGFFCVDQIIVKHTETKK